MAGITFASKVKDDGSFTIPEEAVDTLGLHPGDEIQVHIEAARHGAWDHAYYDQKLNELIAEADHINLNSPARTSENRVATFGEILKEKYRKQGFDF